MSNKSPAAALNGITKKKAEVITHPLQRAWDTAVILACQNGHTVGQLLQAFVAAHADAEAALATKGNSANRLRRTPAFDELPSMPVTGWLHEVGLGKITDSLHKRHLVKVGAPIPAALLDTLERSPLDCTMTAQQGKLERIAARKIKLSGTALSNMQHRQYRTD